MLLITHSQKVRKIVDHVSHNRASLEAAGLDGALFNPLTQVATVEEALELTFPPTTVIVDADSTPVCGSTHGVYMELGLFRALHRTSAVLLTAARPDSEHVRHVARALRVYRDDAILSHAQLADPKHWARACLFHAFDRQHVLMQRELGQRVTEEKLTVKEARHVFALMEVAPYFADVKRAVQVAYWPENEHSYQSIARAFRKEQQVNAKTLMDASRLATYLRIRELGTTKTCAARFLTGSSQQAYRRHLKQSGKITMTQLENVSAAQGQRWLLRLITEPQEARLTFSTALQAL